jgi:hypothetical protein
MFVTRAVLHIETFLLNEDAPENMDLWVGRQGWAGRWLDATLPRARRREAAVQVRSKIREKKRAFGQKAQRPELVNSIRRGEERGVQG